MTKQFINSLKQIIYDPRTSNIGGFYRHGLWQARKILNLFPCVLQFSRSQIMAFHKRCGVSSLINSRNLYNYNNFMLIQHLFNNADGGYFFDIGANIGAYTIIAKEQKNVTAYAFEPHPQTFAYLKKNVELNQLAEVFMFNLAVGDENKEILFSDDPGGSENKIIADYEEKGIHVQLVRLEKYLCQNFNYPVFVKVDVEGFELEVLLGCGHYLIKIDILQVEINDLQNPGEKTSELLSILREHFLGPFFVDFDSQAITENIRLLDGDPIFISKNYFSEFKKEFQFVSC